MSSVPKEPKINWLACIGDSITNSDMSLYIPKSQEYPKLVKQMIGGNCRERNLGVPGNTSGAALLRLPDILRYAPSVAVIYLGINDCLSSIPTATMTSNISSIISGLQGVGCNKIILCQIHTPLTATDYSAYRTALANYASANSIPLCDLSTMSLVAGDFFPDNLHLNASGQVKIAAKVKATLDAQGWAAVLQN